MNRGADRPISEFSTLVEVLRWRAFQQPEQRAYTYLLDGEVEGGHLTYAALDRQARAVAALLQSYSASGERALLLYPTGLEFIAAFYGCLYAGVIPVPQPPPNPTQQQRMLPRLGVIKNDALASLALTKSSILSKIEGVFSQAPELQTMRWLATDTVAEGLEAEWKDPAVSRDTLALLQYTSGSTSAPRGVMVSHGNLIHSSAHINHAFELTPDKGVSVSWLPAFHDMGLTNGIIGPMCIGRPSVLMPPQSFLQQPVRWLRTISRYRGTVSGGPNSAYELCTRRITPEQRETLDLSSWYAAFTGAEPVRADTMKRFAAAFASYGFRPCFFYPCYGLAEATLMVSGGLVKDEPVIFATQSQALAQNRIVEASEHEANVRTLVGCGRAMRDTKIAIVHPESLRPCPAGIVGEIWVSGPSVAHGYWNRPEETERTFRAHWKTGEGPFLRTGDLGFLKDGELYVTGRLKDLIIIGGRNLYPHDIELTAEQSHPAIRAGCCAAFSVDVADNERLILAVEVERRHKAATSCQPGEDARPHSKGRLWPDGDAVDRAIRRAVAEVHDVRVHAVVLLRAGSLPKTTSGKLQRGACQANFLNGTFDTPLSRAGCGEVSRH